MGIFQRATDIFAANVSDFVDRFENPEKMLKHIVHEMESALEASSVAVARSIATETLLGKRRTEHLAQVTLWDQRAAQAVKSGDEPLARRALVQKLEHQQAIAKLDPQIAAAAVANASLQQQLNALRTKNADARTQLAMFSARQAAATAQRQATTCFTQPSGTTQILARFDRYVQELEFAEAEITAFVELQTTAESTLSEQFERSATEQAVEVELARLRERDPAID